METEKSPITNDILKEILNNCRYDIPINSGQIILHMATTVDETNKRLRDFEVREDDTWILGYPRSGTTWTQEMVWLLKNNCNFEKAKTIDFMERIHPFEQASVKLMTKDSSHVDNIDEINTLKSPRFIKSHLNRDRLPDQLWTKKPKMVFIFRNPKEVAVSLFKLFLLFSGYSGPLELIVKSVVQETDPHSYPFWKHVIEFWEKRKEPNFLYLTFNEMKKDLPSVIKKTADFLEVKYTKDQETALIEYLSFTNMRNNKAITLEDDFEQLCGLKGKKDFVRKGEINSWINIMPPEMIEMFDKWIDKNLEGTDFPREYI